MSDVGLPIEGGKYKSYIDSLYDLAETKRKPLDKRLEVSQQQRRIWLDTNRNLTNLRLSLSQLRGADSVFGNRMASSGNEDAMLVSVQRHVTPADIEIKVQSKAAADRFFSAELDPSFNVKAGQYNFEVGITPVNLNFAGGTLADFAKALTAVNPDILRASLVQSSPDKQTFFLESQLTGQDNKINFKDMARTFAFDTAMITDQVESRYMVESDNRGLKTGNVLDIKQPIKMPNGRFLGIATAGDVPLTLKAGSFLSFTYTTQQRPVSMVNYVQTPENASRAIAEGRLTQETEPSRLPLPDLFGEPSVYLKVNGDFIPLVALNPTATEKQVKIDLSGFKGMVEGIVLTNNNTAFDFETRNMQLFVPGDIDFRPVNPASVATNAEFTLDGVRISRPTNVINDVMPGVEFNVQGASDRPFKVAIKNDVERATTAIEDFIWAYYVNMGNVNVVTSQRTSANDSSINMAVVDELAYLKDAEREQAIKNLGLFQGNQNFTSLKNRLTTMMGNAYQVGSPLEGDKKMTLADIGISTNDRGAMSTTASRRGYYDIKDPAKLKAALENRWDEVEQMFIGNKEPGAIVATGGIADVMTTFINSYINNGVIQTQTTTLDSTIKRQETEITDFNDKLKEQRKKWEADFAKAESAEREFNRLNQQMNNTFFNSK